MLNNLYNGYRRGRYVEGEEDMNTSLYMEGKREKEGEDDESVVSPLLPSPCKEKCLPSIYFLRAKRGFSISVFSFLYPFILLNEVFSINNLLYSSLEVTDAREGIISTLPGAEHYSARSSYSTLDPSMRITAVTTHSSC